MKNDNNDKRIKKAELADFPRFEAEMLKIWEKEKTFEASLKQREGKKRFSFYDGPPFANGLPHYGHVVAITEKDSVTRYKTMRGYLVPRRNGWDTHGLPVEYEVEKQLGISGKKQIEEMGIDKFNQAARASVFKYKEQWEEFMTRIGRWADKDSYATLDDDYIESVWWVLSELHEKGLVYRGFRSNPYCPRCATPLSNFEVNQNYKDNVADPSVYVKFQLADDANTSLLAWTTTPWTLPANAALAVDPKAEYVTVELVSDGDGWKKGERLILAKGRVGELELRKAEYRIHQSIKGASLQGVKYQGLYEKFVGRTTELTETDTESGKINQKEAIYRVYADDAVSLEDGTGILHVAPRYGETDLALGLRVGLPLIESVDGSGQMNKQFDREDGLEPIAGMFFKEADRLIVADLAKKGRIFAAETSPHTYPFCWRCETPLMYFAMPSWFVKVTELRDKLVANNEKINWVPEHIKQGRFGNWLAEARDWNISRNRYWGAPLPIWVNEADQGDFIVVRSQEELRQLTGEDKFDLHRPGIDAVVIERDGKKYKRVEEVFDCWFESGSMPYAQDHYPFENRDGFDERYPAEFIAEGLDQTRGWFYTLHVLGTALFDQPAFKNVVVHGMVLAADGKKLSKRLRNYPEPGEIFEGTGADSLRFFLMSSSVENGEDVRFSYDAVNEVRRNVFMTLWNTHSFLTTYAEVDGWAAGKSLEQPDSTNALDRWMLSRLNQAVQEVTDQADVYKIAAAVRPIRDVVDDLSNWYVRRSRRRFWKSENDTDKQQAYATLHYVLVRICQLLAPWAPFVSDKIYRELTVGMDVPSSVHLTDWPEGGQVDTKLLLRMSLIRDAVTEGLSARAEAKIKVRQPLSEATVFSTHEVEADLLDIVKEELNVKNIVLRVVKDRRPTEMNTNITRALKLEGMAREIIRYIQQARKQAGLEVDNRIKLRLGGEDGTELMEAVGEYREMVMRETLATEITWGRDDSDTLVAVDGQKLWIGLTKV
jgi:isoleucyl-tRNA synthetase